MYCAAFASRAPVWRSGLCGGICSIALQIRRPGRRTQFIYAFTCPRSDICGAKHKEGRDTITVKYVFAVLFVHHLF